MTDYALMTDRLISLAEASACWMPLLSNASALVFDALADINWAGFYLVSEGRLLLGPFQGRPACVTIDKDRGVCGTAWDKDATLLVPDVHAFPGHIPCDSASRSEIVVPVHRDGSVAGVLDIDSPLASRFTEEDKSGLEAFVKVLERIIIWDSLRISAE